jgi:tagaturonate reductase
MNYTSKMKMRNIPLLSRYSQRLGRVPVNMAMGFAAYLLFMKCKAGSDGCYYGEAAGKRYAIQDEMAARFAEKWATNNNIDTFADSILGDKQLWDIDLSTLEGFAKAVKENLAQLEQQGIMATMTGKQIKTVA